MQRAFVTGATGFVGSNLVRYLLANHWQVNCLVRDLARAKQLQEQGSRLILGSLADPQSVEQAVEDCQVVFHVAGRIRALRSEQFRVDNVEGSRTVARVCAALPSPPVVVKVSSLAAGGPGTPDQPRVESDRNQPVSQYGRSKLQAEEAMREFAGQLPVSIVRPPAIFGPGDKSSFYWFRGIQASRLHPLPGLRSFPLSLLYVEDLCRALLLVAQQGERLCARDCETANPARGIYYVATGEPVTYRELGRLVAQAMNCRFLPLSLPKTFFWLTGAAAEVLGHARREPSLLNLDKVREIAVDGWVCSDEKIRSQLDYRPADSLEECFRQTLAWYRQHGWL